jgi:uncharacterized protein YndB with AHSA1/START domain
MTDLTMERSFKAAPETVFAFLTQRGNILKWWGPEGMTVPEADMDFTRPGPWSSVMMAADGRRFKVTGTVISVEPPRTVELTWAWHDERDRRGHESRVRFEVRPGEAGGTHFTLRHTGLADEESAKGHESGWMSALRKLERMDATNPK